MLTLFAAIRPPEPIIDEILSVQTGFDGMNWIVPENLHITLGYFGPLHDETTEILDREINRNPGTGFDLRLGTAGTFGGKYIHTLWLGVEPSPALSDLHHHIRKAARRAGVEMEKRKYVPHVSLAYPRRAIDKIALAKFLNRLSGWRSDRFLVDEFALYSSHHNKTGPNSYRVEATYPLLG